jgi:hypothetical protein
MINIISDYASDSVVSSPVVPQSLDPSKIGTMRISFDIKLYLVTNSVNRRHKKVSFCRIKIDNNRYNFQIKKLQTVSILKNRIKILELYLKFIKQSSVMEVCMRKYSINSTAYRTKLGY